ncbi:MAG: XAC2610-related protein, partial [Flavobacteriales bacterium]
KDIFMRNNCGSGGCTYWIWNYSEQENSYVYNEKLSNVLGLELDTIHQFVVIHNRSGWDQERWDSLKYVNNKLTFVKGLLIQRWIDVNGNSWTKQTREEMVDNKLFTTVDSPMSK